MLKKFLFFLLLSFCLIFPYKYTSAEQSLHENKYGSTKMDIECELCHIESLSKEISLMGNTEQITMSKSNPDKSGLLNSSLTSASRDMCYSCHDGSAKDSRKTILKKNSHPEISTILAKNKEQNTLISNKLPLTKDNNFYCGTCHLPHELSEKRGKEPGFFRASFEKLCQNCHFKENSDPSVTHVYPSSLSANKKCFICHQNHETTDQMLLPSNAENTDICSQCHQKTEKIKDSPHNLVRSAPEEKNILGKTTKEAGLCSACHSIHMGDKYKLWSKPFDNKKEKNITALCGSCHKKGKCAENKLTGLVSHPVDINLVVNPPENKILPLLNNKMLVCSTCHEIHSNKKNFLYLDNQKGELCAKCHVEQKSITGTNHDLSAVLPNSENDLGQKAGESGVCSSCHLVHNAFNVKLWALKIPPGKNIIQVLCEKCHNKKGIARKTAISNYSHPINMPILQYGLITTLPLYTAEGIKLISGNITCSTCHNVHRWSPESEGENQIKKVRGTGKNSFLRKTTSSSSELCTDCHQKEGFVAKTNHDLTFSKPRTLNINGSSVEKSGVCSACHLVHNAPDKFLWARKLPVTGIISEKFCKSCHQKNGLAKNSIISGNSHILDVKIPGDISIPLPVYDESGKKNKNGVITCLTCHDPHLWDPEYFIRKSDQKNLMKMKENEKDEKKIFTDKQVDSAHVGEVAFTQGDHVFIDLKENSNIQENAGLLVIDEYNIVKSKVIIERINTFTKTFKAFAKILTRESSLEITLGDYVIDESLLIVPQSIKGNGNNSFLRITNNASSLCLGCHPKKKSVLSTKHDLAFFSPTFNNAQNNNPLESGTCSSCHLVHNAYNNLLAAKKIKVKPADPASGICSTCHSKNGIASGKALSPKSHHFNQHLYPNNISIRSPADYLPLFDKMGAQRTNDGIVSCSTCHDVHQWNPDDPQITGKEEGNANNSFLRIKNKQNRICDECHLTLKSKPMTAAALAVEEKDIFISTPLGEENPLLINISTFENNQIVNKSKQILKGNISDESVTQATLILNGTAFPVKVKDGVFENQIKLSNGKNNIKVTAINKNGNFLCSSLLTLTLDAIPLKILSYVYPKPVKLSNEFRIKLIFNKTLDPNSSPLINLIGDGNSAPVVETGGEIKTTYRDNDTYISPDIILDKNMAGNITIAVSNVYDLAGNKIEKLAEESFKLKADKCFNLDKPDCIDILEGKTIKYPRINIKFNITDAEKMIISEDINFNYTVWENFAPSKTFILSNNAGPKNIYFKFKDKYGNISVPTLKTCILVPASDDKNNIPKIIKNDLILTKENSPYYFQGDILVSWGATLTIQPGVKLLFSELKKPVTNNTFITEKSSLRVEGRLICNGKKGDEIEFTSQTTSSRPGDWEGINIKNMNDNVLNHTYISFAKTGLILDNSNAKITNCVFSNNINGISASNNSIVNVEESVISKNKINGIITFDSGGKIAKNEFSKNKTGIFCNDLNSPSIFSNYIMDNETGINCQGGSSPHIANNTIIENNLRGLMINYLSYPAVVNNLFVDNKEEGIVVIESSPLIYKNLIRDNNIGILCDKSFRKFIVAENSIFNNKKFNFYLKNYTSELNITGNWWGTEKINLIDLYLYDKNDDPSLGKLIYQPILHSQAFSEIALSITEIQKPVINNITFRKPVRINPAFRIKFDFLTPINPYIEPKLYLKNLSGGKDPVILNNDWCFMDGKEPNSVVFTPEILIDTSMGGKIDVALGNIQSLSGSIMKKTKAVTFEIETSLGIKEGEFTNEKEININSNYPLAYEIQISENSTFSDAPWIAYNKAIPFTLSEPAGKKNIYIRYKNTNGEISLSEKLTIDYDNIPPNIISSEVPPEDIKYLRSLKIKLIFDETLNTNYKPALTAVVNNKDKVSIPIKEGYFASENGFNNVYYSPTIALNENFYGDVFFEVEGITDLAGNKIPVTKLAGFRYDIVLPEIKNVIIREGLYTNQRNIHFLISAVKAYEIQVSENPLSPDDKWSKFTPEFTFNLSSGDGPKEIYLRIRDQENNISKITLIKTDLDEIKPYIKAYYYPKPVTLDDKLKITIYFNEMLDTTIEPEIILISTGIENPVVPKGGIFFKSNDKFAVENNTYTTPPIVFKPSMGGAITIVVKNTADLAGNIMDLNSEETFQIDTIPPVLNSFTADKEYTNISKINLKIDAEDAHKMILSENKNMDIVNNNWASYKSQVPLTLSKDNGRKTIYLWLKDFFDNISGPFTSKVTVDRIEPKILFYKFKFDPDNSSLTVSFVFSETMNDLRESQIQLIGNGQISPSIDKGGIFSSTLLKNDTYTTTPILLNKKMTGEITIVINKAFDRVDNCIKTTTDADFFYSPIFPMITAIIPRKEYSSINPWTNFYLYVYGAKKMMVSENPSFKESNWINYSEYFQFQLSKDPGQKAVYFKFKDEKGNISYPNKIMIDKINQPDNFDKNTEYIDIFPSDTTNSREIIIKNNLTKYTHQLISESPIFRNEKWEIFSNKTKYVLSETYGKKILYFYFRDEIGNYSDIFSKKIYYQKPINKSKGQQKLHTLPENKN